MNPPLRLVVSIDDQKLMVIRRGQCIREFVVSTSAKGMGFKENSNRTPTGRFRICEKIGDGEPCGTIFKSRVPSGIWTPGENPDHDLVLTRILRIEGLEDRNANTFRRFIYFHGTNREDLLGSPASHGCIRLSNDDMIELFDIVAPGDEVEVRPATRPQGRLLFMACDRTLSAIHGMDELARLRGIREFTKVSALTEAAMNGRIPLNEAIRRSADLVRPDQAMAAKVAELYIDAMVSGARDFIAHAKEKQWIPVIVSGAFGSVIAPLAGHLGIQHVEAVPLFFHPDGSYAGYGSDFPTASNHGKSEVIREWMHAMSPERSIMIGHGVPDLDVKAQVDAFICFNGIVNRNVVCQAADHCLESMDDLPISGGFPVNRELLE